MCFTCSLNVEVSNIATESSKADHLLWCTGVAEGSCSRRLLLCSFSYLASSVLLPREGSLQVNAQHAFYLRNEWPGDRINLKEDSHYSFFGCCCVMATQPYHFPYWNFLEVLWSLSHHSNKPNVCVVSLMCSAPGHSTHAAEGVTCCMELTSIPRWSLPGEEAGLEQRCTKVLPCDSFLGVQESTFTFLEVGRRIKH